MRGFLIGAIGAAIILASLSSTTWSAERAVLTYRSQFDGLSFHITVAVPQRSPYSYWKVVEFVERWLGGGFDRGVKNRVLLEPLVALLKSRSQTARLRLEMLLRPSHEEGIFLFSISTQGELVVSSESSDGSDGKMLGKMPGKTQRKIEIQRESDRVFFRGLLGQEHEQYQHIIERLSAGIFTSLLSSVGGQECDSRVSRL